MTKRSAAVYLSAIGLLLAIVLGWYVYSFLSQPEPDATSFDGVRAYEDVKTQVAFGPRVSGTEAHAEVRAWMREELEAAGWQVEVQESEAMGHPIFNVVAKRSDDPPQIILGAHYDSRMAADNDPDPTNCSPGSRAISVICPGAA